MRLLFEAHFHFVVLHLLGSPFLHGSWAQPIVNTGFAAQGLALAALGLGTFGTQRLVAELAPAGAVVADDLAAVGTDSRTLVAHGVVAVMAIADLFAIHHIAAVAAGGAVPAAQGDIRAIRVVGLENTPDHAEEIAQSSFFQCGPNGSRPFTFAEHFVADMGVRDRVICGGRMGLDGNDVVRDLVVHLLQLAWIQGDPKWPQIDLFQRDRFGRHR